MAHIRVVSPSGAIEPSLIDESVARLKQWGHIVSVCVHARAHIGRFSGNEDDRLNDLIDALTAPEVDYVLCARGGYGLQQIIYRIDKAIRLRFTEWNRAVIIGFSDVTELHQLMGLYGCPSWHAIMCKHIATLSDDAAPLQLFRNMLDGDCPCYVIPAHVLNRVGEVSGTLIGGNLSVLYGLQGTLYSLEQLISQQPHPILLIEDIAEQHYHIERMMHNLKMSGVLARLGGLIVGQFSDCVDDPTMCCTVYETIAKAVQEYHYPVLFNFPVGHVEDNRPLCLNTRWTLNVYRDGGNLNRI